MSRSDRYSAYTDATTGMPIEFINNNATIDPATRRRIRGHVATGKNAGRTLVRPSRKNLGLATKKTTAPARIQKAIENIGDSESNDSNENMVHEIERQIGDGLSVLSVPKQSKLASTGLVQKAFSFISGSQNNPKLNAFLEATGSHTSMWVQFMFLDEAYFHCIMAMSVTVLNSFLVKQVDPSEGIHHLSQTFHLINERISRNVAVSDTTLAVVVAMAQYARLQGQYRQGLVHLGGLQRMIELRGGVSQLTKNEPGLSQMIFKTDFEYSLHEGSTTRFNIEDIVASSTAMYGLPNGLRREDNNPNLPILNSRLLRQLSADLQRLLRDVTDLAWLVNDTSVKHRPKLNGYPFHDNLVMLGYRLVQINPLGGPRRMSHVENVVHLGLTAFIISFLRGFDRRIPEIPILCELARSAAQDSFGNEQENQELLLWILFVGAASIFKHLDDAWLIPKTNQAIQTLDLHSWEDLVRTLVKFPWVNAVHDTAGQELWNRVTFHCRTLSEVTSE